MIKYYENDSTEVTQERVNELMLQGARADWIVECVECIKDAVKELERLKEIISEELSTEGVFNQTSKDNFQLIYNSFVFSLLGIVIFSDQFKRERKYDLLKELKWENLDCKAIDDAANIKVSRYMRDYFAHVRKGRQGFHFSIKSELLSEKFNNEDWANHAKGKAGNLPRQKTVIVDIQKMVTNRRIRLPKDIGINDIESLLIDRVYTDLRGKPTGKTYIDLFKFAESMPKELYTIWRAFVDSNRSEFDELSQQNGAVITRINEIEQGEQHIGINFGNGIALEGINFVGIDDSLKKKLQDALKVDY